MPAFRAHPVGCRLGPLIAALPGWRELVHATTRDPVRDLDWIYAASPNEAGDARGLVLFAFAGGDAPIDGAIDALTMRTTAAPFDLERFARGTLAKLDDGTRVLVRAHPHLLAAAPPQSARESSASLLRANVRAPLDAPEALYFSMAHPHERAREVPEAIVLATVHVASRPDGGAEVRADALCNDDASARATADEIRARVQRANNLLVRIATADVLGGVRVDADGATVHVHVSPSREQLQSTLSLAASMLGADIGR